MPAYWEIDVEGVRQDADAWGVVVASYDADNAGSETVTITIDDDFDSTTLGWAYKDTVKIYRNLIKVFEGTITSTPRVGSSNNEALSFTVSGPWWWLENITLRLPRYYREQDALAKTTKNSAYCMLMAAQDGTPITTGAQIEAVIDLAITLGAPITKGTIFAGTDFWTTPVKAVTCAQAIQQVLSIHQDAGVWFDHSTSPPTMNVNSVDSMSAVSIAADGSDEISNIEISDRSDLIPDAIVIEYEITITADGDSYLDTVTEIAPPSATGNEPFARFVTIPLRGASITHEYSQIQTVPIPEEGAVDEATQLWLARNDTLLKEIVEELGAAALQLSATNPAGSDIKKLTRFNLAELEDAPAAVTGVQRAAAAAAVSEIPNQIIKGNVPDWSNKKVGKVLVQCTVAITNDNLNALSLPLQKKVRTKLSTKREFGGIGYWTGLFSITVNATEASTGTLTRIASYNPAEAIPVGVAAAYYASLNRPWHQGSFTLSEEEAWGTAWLGKKINVTSGLTAWATMNMPVQSLSIDIVSGESSIQFGPWGVMGIADAIEQLRLSRQSPLEYQFADDSNEGKESGANKVGSWNTAPETSSDPPPGKDATPDFWTDYDAAGTQTWIYPGRLNFRHPVTGISDIAITVDSEPLLDEPLALTGNGTLKVHLTTDRDGIPDGDAEVIFTTDVGQSHRPVGTNGSSDPGQIGDYYWKIAEIAGTPLKATEKRTGAIDYVLYDPAGESGHPWKVTIIDNTSVNVAHGKILGEVNENAGLSNIPTWYHLKEVENFIGGDVTSIAVSGSIYAEFGQESTATSTIFEADMADGLLIDRIIASGGGVTVHHAASLPTTGTNVFIVELAKITVTDGSITDIDQVMTHNPTVRLIDIPPQV